MERIIIVHWNKSTGPEPILQYPPERKFPSKDLLLKIWALHELDKESSMIEYIPEIEGMNNEQFVSIIQKFEGEVYFLIIVYFLSFCFLFSGLKAYSQLLFNCFSVEFKIFEKSCSFV